MCVCLIVFRNIVIEDTDARKAVRDLRGFPVIVNGAVLFGVEVQDEFAVTGIDRKGFHLILLEVLDDIAVFQLRGGGLTEQLSDRKDQKSGEDHIEDNIFCVLFHGFPPCADKGLCISEKTKRRDLSDFTITQPHELNVKREVKSCDGFPRGGNCFRRPARLWGVPAATPGDRILRAWRIPPGGFARPALFPVTCCILPA